MSPRKADWSCTRSQPVFTSSLALGGCVEDWIVLVHSPCILHVLMVLSEATDTIWLPSLENATDCTADVCPWLSRLS